MATKHNVKAIRKRLNEDRASLEEQIASLEQENEDNQVEEMGIGHHYGDDATDMMLRERNLPVRGNAEELVAEIDAALERLDDGSYGTCARCGKEINPERLEARPAAIYCIDCQSIVDNERQNGFSAES